MNKRFWWIGLVTTVVVLIGVLVLQFSGVAWARPSSQAPDPETVTIPYPGRLTDEAGHAVDGSYDFTFALYDDLDGGNRLWSETREGVAVSGGSFVVSLGAVQPIPAELLAQGERWLEVSVRGSGEDAFTALSPRQQIRADATPDASIQAGAPCPHDHWGESWTSTGPGLTLTLEGGAASVSLISLLSSVYASHDVLIGVMGVSGGSGVGVWGQSVDNHGVYGTSTNQSGGYFTSGQDHFDIALGGQVGRINAAENADSELYLSSNGDIILKLDNNSGSDNVLRVKASGGNDVFTVDEGGNVRYAGSISPMLAADRIETLGSVGLVEGQAYVALEPDFAGEGDYQVFMTPLSQEPVLLYVTAKTADGFSVAGVTLDGRPATCAFDYRVVVGQPSLEGVTP
ncbi:MAG: hypothetical protein JXA37_12875 [Chloroflexia bacterium]|nr:hypothetical protein [Chloroflexia bacterium]